MKTNQYIVPPKGGWKEETVYEVDVAFSPDNPVHPALFYSGFLNNDGTPGGYNRIWNPTYHIYSIEDVHYLRVVREVMLWPKRYEVVLQRELEKHKGNYEIKRYCSRQHDLSEEVSTKNE